MVNSGSESAAGFLYVRRLVWCYVVIVLATLGVLSVLSSIGSTQATSEAWGHAILVGVFAVVLPVRMGASRRRRAGALRAVGIIAGVLIVVNGVEAVIPHLFPVWMRVEMVGTAMLMGAILISVVQGSRTDRRAGGTAAHSG